MCVEFQLVLLMAPIVYYLNKDYQDSPHYNHNNAKDSKSNNRNGLAERTKTIRRKDSNKLFYWLWTVPGAALIGCILLGLAGSFYNVYSNDLPPSWFYTMADPDSKALYFGAHLTKLWTHLAVFAMGIIAGVECRRASRNVIRGYGGGNLRIMSHNYGLRLHKNQMLSSTSSLPVMSHNDSLSSGLRQKNDMNSSNISIDINSSRENISGSESGLNNDGYNNNNNSNNINGSLLLEICGCLLAITTMTTIIFSTHEWSLNDLPKPIVAGIFDAGSRFLWSMALIWMLYMVSVPDKDMKFSLIARSLGHPNMVCLGKLSFLIYIIHPFVHTTVLAIQEQPIYSSWLMLFHILIGNITITVILASFVSLFVEMPCRNLFRRRGTSLLLTDTIDSTASSSSLTTSQLAGLR